MTGCSLVEVAAGSGAAGAWQAQGLPRDAASAENATLVCCAGRRPLAIDPQQQVYRMIQLFILFRHYYIYLNSNKNEIV